MISIPSIITSLKRPCLYGQNPDHPVQLILDRKHTRSSCKVKDSDHPLVTLYRDYRIWLVQQST